MGDHYPDRGKSTQTVQVWDVSRHFQLTVNRRVQFSTLHFSIGRLGRPFHFGDSMKNDLAVSAAKAAPAVGSNFWLWLTGHDINWWVAVATIAYIGLQAYYLVKNKGKRALLDG